MNYFACDLDLSWERAAVGGVHHSLCELFQTSCLIIPIPCFIISRIFADIINCLHFCSLACELSHRRYCGMHKLNSKVDRGG